MKNYFNQYEQANHLILMTAMIANKNLIDGDCITDNEREMLNKVMELVSEFSESVFERLGDGYQRSIKNKANRNTLKLVSRDVHHKNNVDMEDFIDNETLLDMIELSCGVDCEGCEKTEKDCLKCGWYKIKSYLHHEGKNDDTNLCPFRKEKTEFCEINFEDL